MYANTCYSLHKLILMHSKGTPRLGDYFANCWLSVFYLHMFWVFMKGCEKEKFWNMDVQGQC